MELAHGFVQIARQLRHRLCAHHFFGHRGHYPSHLPRADAAQKRFPDQHRDLFGPPLKTFHPARQKTLPPGARNAQPQRTQPSHEIPLASSCCDRLPPVVPPLVHFPHRIPVAFPPRIRLQQLFFPEQLRLPIHIAPETLFHLRQKMLVMLRDRDLSPSGVSLLSRNGFCLIGKANLHPSLFHNRIYVTPARKRHTRRPSQSSPISHPDSASWAWPFLTRKTMRPRRPTWRRHAR